MAPSVVRLLALVSASAAALQLSPRAAASRRTALQLATATGLAGLTASPDVALGEVYAERNGFGGTGQLRSDIGPSVRGDGVEILVTDLSYKEMASCPSGFFIPEKGGPWTCLEISATALNQGRQKKAGAAEVFGQLYDAEGFSCLAVALDPSQKSAVASIEGPFVKGEPTPIKFVAAVQSRSPRPLRFAGFKAGYRNARVEKVFATFDPCEIDSSKCDDPLDQPDNAKALLNGKGFTYN